ncbi:MAG: DUF2946 family protein [Enhydrobacter sp.]|nr:DUF2946 family protein [Enhydrobacter sp.]
MRANVNSQLRSVSLFVALVAVTLNFLQPLAHAAAMRDGLASALWTAFCKSAAASDPQSDGVPVPGGASQHECCLGLAHAGTIADPPATFVSLAPLAALAHPPRPAERLASAAIRDGPAQPRGPPFIA